MKIVFGDSVEYMKTIKSDEKPDLVYLDPMYPEKLRAKNKSGVKKEIFLLK
jgi:16S rRNA G966 N2-methylase RsmD